MDRRLSVALATLSLLSLLGPAGSLGARHAHAADLGSPSVQQGSIPTTRRDSPHAARLLPATRAAGAWRQQIPPLGPKDYLNSIACPTATTCYATGGPRGIMLTTTNGGRAWSVKRLLPAQAKGSLIGIACLSASACDAVGTGGAILVTTDGGQSWTAQVSGVAQDLGGIACPSTTVCYAVGDRDTILVTTDGGHAWRKQHSGARTGFFQAVSCPTTSTCDAVGYKGVILSTTDGGHTWRSLRSPTSHTLSAVDCPSVLSCVADGIDGIVVTTDGGRTWTLHDYSEVGVVVWFGVACVTTSLCYVAGTNQFGGVVEVTTNGGRTWHGEHNSADNLGSVSCVDATTCFFVGNTSTGTAVILAKTAGGAE